MCAFVSTESPGVRPERTPNPYEKPIPQIILKEAENQARLLGIDVRIFTHPKNLQAYPWEDNWEYKNIFVGAQQDRWYKVDRFSLERASNWTYLLTTTHPSDKNSMPEAVRYATSKNIKPEKWEIALGHIDNMCPDAKALLRPVYGLDGTFVNMPERARMALIEQQGGPAKQRQYLHRLTANIPLKQSPGYQTRIDHENAVLAVARGMARQLQRGEELDEEILLKCQRTLDLVAATTAERAGLNYLIGSIGTEGGMLQRVTPTYEPIYNPFNPSEIIYTPPGCVSSDQNNEQNP